VSWLVVLRPVRDQMPFEPTEEESRIVSDSAVAAGVMTTEIGPYRIAVR
jgi:hypothetical protein